MALNKDQKTKAIGIISKAQSVMLSDKIQTDILSDSYIYYSARPLWLGLLDSLRNEGITYNNNNKNNIQISNILVTDSPIPFEMIERNELLPVSSGSLYSLSNELIENEVNLVLYSQMSAAVYVYWRPDKQYLLEKFICKDAGGAIQDVSVVNSYISDDDVARRVLNSISWGYTKDITRSKSINKYLTDDFDSCLHLAELSNIIDGIHPEFSKTGEIKDNVERFLQVQVDTDPTRAARSAKFWIEKYTGSAPFTLSPKFAKEYGNKLLSLVVQNDKNQQIKPDNSNNKPKKPKRLTKWVDLAEHNLYLGEQHFSDNRDRLMLVDLDNYITKNKRQEQLKNIGFIPLAGTPRFDGGIYYLTNEDQRLKPSSLAAALGIPRCPVIDMDIDEIPKMFKAKVFERFEINVNALSLCSDLLGTNSDGYEVFNSPTGRFIRQSKFDVILEGSDAADNVGHTSFLRVRTNQDLRLCAELFVKDIFNGGRKQWTDVTKFAQVIFPDDHADDRQLHQLQEAIEAASYRTFAVRSVDVNDQDAFNLAKNVYYGLPVARMRTGESLALQQYSTTLPLSVVAQRLVIGKDITDGKSLIEPTAGNGGLLNRIGPNIKKYLMELDPNRVDALKEAFPDAIIKQGDATLFPFSKTFDLQQGVDYVITNPPFGRMEAPKSFDVLPNVRRLDHYIALQALKTRKNDGRAVLILGADKNQSDGTLSGGSKNLMYYLNDFYHVEGAVELDGRLYSRQGAAFNVRVVVVGQKRDQPIQAVISEKLPVLTTYDELWEWSEGLIKRFEADHQIPSLQQTDNAEPESPLPLQSPDLPKAPTATNSSKVNAPAKRRTKSVQADSGATNAPDSVASITEEPANISDSSHGHPVDTEEPPQTDSIDVQKTKKPQKAVVRNINEFQAPYQAASKLGIATAMIPINMSAATYSALNRLEMRYGSVDDYVSSKLKYRKEDLSSYFSPEQIDAIALGISAVENNRGMINADQTGIGKGRFVAAMLRYARLNNKLPIFLSVKPELFTDIFRDISDINSMDLFNKPFIFNNTVNVKVYGSESEELFSATSKKELNDAIKTGEVENNVDLVMSTYSQFGRERSKNNKAGLLLSLANKDAMIILDESHVAAGSSNTADVVSDAVRNAGSALYASSTPIKGCSNFSLYSKCFPASVDIINLSETLTLGGEGLQEAISANMALDGSIIRREHDYSKLTFETRHPSSENEQRNRDLMDKVADILSEMAYLSGDVASIVKSINTDKKQEWESIPEALRNGNRMGASSMNFSSRLYNISRQFILGIKTEETATAALEALSEGMKPVVAVENTGESLLRQLIASKTKCDELSDELETLDEKGALTPDEALRRQLLVDSIASASKEIIFEKSPQFRELLEIVLDRLAKISIRGRYGDLTTQNAADDPEYFEKQEDVREKIRNFPDLSLMPIDEFKHSLQSKGFRVAEVSGRKVSLIPVVINNQSMWRVSFHDKADAVSNVAGFQNGKFDAIVITRSGSTGISLHSSNRFADSDTRQRYFIVQQKAANISEFLQWMGRVNRKDQVIPPIIANIESGLPAEARQTMMHNSKLRKLSANTTSNRENENLEGDEDLLNSVGDKVALEYLIGNPDIAEALDIALPKAGDSPSSYAAENPFINKLMGRLMMIPVSQQETILKLLAERFIERVEQLEQEGINPFKVDVYDWKAEVVSEQDMQTGNLSASDSSFDEPVKIVEVNYEIVVQPIRFDELKRQIKRNNNALFRDDEGRLDIAGKMAKFTDALKMSQEQFVKDHLPAKEKKLKLTLSEIALLKDAQGAKSALERSEYLIKSMDYYKAGRHIEFPDPDTSGMRVGVIAEVDFPRERSQLFFLSKYRMKIAFAGDEKLTEMSLASLRARGASLDSYIRADIDPDKTLEQYYYQQRKAIEATELEFNNAPTGLLTKQKFLLEGNIYRACEIAAEQQMGYPVLYTDVDGNRKRAVLMKEHITPDHLNALPLSMNAKDAYSYINEFIKEDHPDRSQHIQNNALQLFDSPEKTMADGKGLKLIWRPNNNCFDLSISGIKSQNNNLVSNSLIFDVGENTPYDSLAIKISGNRVCMKGGVKMADLEKLLTLLEKGKHIGKFYIPNPKLEIIKELQQKNINIVENQYKKTDYHEMVM
ncbi:TPA: strawberry notch C-terminal domain-containing protein [Yersinia enterocolitica]